MRGSNLFVARNRSPHSLGYGASNGRACVFVSHKREDAGMAKAVADALIEFDVDVWLDLDQLGFSEPVTKDDHLRLTHAIELGLRESSHLLALITPRTQGSWWVPFEIGGSRSLKKGLAFLLHKEVRQVPSYFAVGVGLENKHQLFDWAKDLSNTRLNLDHRAALATLTRSRLDDYIELVLKR